MPKALARKVLAELITFERDHIDYDCNDDPTDAIDVDVDNWVNHEPFWVHETTCKETFPKKLFVNDPFARYLFLDEGHRLFYPFLFTQAVEIYAVYKNPEDQQIEIIKVNNYNELISYSRYAFAKDNVEETLNIIRNQFGVLPGEFEYITYTSRLRLNDELRSIIPAGFLTKSISCLNTQCYAFPFTIPSSWDEDELEFLEKRKVFEYDKTKFQDKYEQCSSEQKRYIIDLLCKKTKDTTMKRFIVAQTLSATDFDWVLENSAFNTLIIKNNSMPNVFSNLNEQIKHLDVSETSNIKPSLVENNTLESLVISKTIWATSAIILFLRRCTALKKLIANNLSQIEPHFIYLQGLAYAQQLPELQLEILSLKNTKISEAYLLSILAKTPYLKKLYVSITENHSQLVTHMPQLIHLSTLTIEYTGTRNDNFTLNLNNLLEKFPNLKSLHISTGATFKINILVNQFTHTQLKKLSVHYCEISDDSFTNLLSSTQAELKKLEMVLDSAGDLATPDLTKINFAKLKKFKVQACMHDAVGPKKARMIELRAQNINVIRDLINKAPNLEFLEVREADQTYHNEAKTVNFDSIKLVDQGFFANTPHLKSLIVDNVPINLLLLTASCPKLQYLQIDNHANFIVEKFAAAPLAPLQLHRLEIRQYCNEAPLNAIFFKYLQCYELKIFKWKTYKSSRNSNSLQHLKTLEKLEIEFAENDLNSKAFIIKVCQNHPSLLEIAFATHMPADWIATVSQSIPHQVKLTQPSTVLPPQIANIADRKNIRINLNTENSKLSTQKVEIYFEGDTVADAVAYRLSAKTRQTYHHGALIYTEPPFNINQCKKVNVAVMSLTALRNRHATLINQGRAVKIGHKQFDKLVPGQYYKLPSKSAYDDILAMVHNVNVYYHQETGLFYIALKPEIQTAQSMHMIFLVEYRIKAFKSQLRQDSPSA